MGFIEGVFTFLEEVSDVIIGFLTKILPLSPVQNYISYVSSVPYLGYINWFCPVGTCVSIMEGWLACIGLWYIYVALLRWVKAVE